MAKKSPASKPAKRSTGKAPAKPKKASAPKTARSKAKPAAAKPATPKTVAAKPRKAPATRKKKESDEGLILAQEVVNGMLEKKAKNITCLDLRNVENAVCDFFIICEGDSTTQINAIAESVEYEVKKKLQARPYHSEGWENSLWILIDYVNVVAHVFEPETRRFYNLESLWADAEEMTFKNQEHSRR